MDEGYYTNLDPLVRWAIVSASNKLLTWCISRLGTDSRLSPEPVVVIFHYNGQRRLLLYCCWIRKRTKLGKGWVSDAYYLQQTHWNTYPTTLSTFGAVRVRLLFSISCSRSKVSYDGSIHAIWPVGEDRVIESSIVGDKMTGFVNNVSQLYDKRRDSTQPESLNSDSNVHETHNRNYHGFYDLNCEMLLAGVWQLETNKGLTAVVGSMV